MNKKDTKVIAQILSKHAVAAQLAGDYDSLTTITSIVMDLVPALKADSPRFGIDMFLRDIYQNDMAAASVRAAMLFVNPTDKVGESE